MENSIFSISVIIPDGKKKRDIHRCVNSCLQQIQLPIEILIIVNGQKSYPDVTKELRAIITTAQIPIQIIDANECKNANEARNIGLLHASGNHVAFLDSDDWWESKHLQEAQKVLSDNDADFYYSSIIVHSKRGTEKLLSEDFKLYRSPQEYLLSYKPAQTSTYVVKKVIALSNKWDPTINRHQDYDFFVRIASKHPTVSSPNAFVNICWDSPVRHKFHSDCLKIIKPWKKNVSIFYYRRHLWTLLKSSLKSFDIGCFRIFFEILMSLK